MSEQGYYYSYLEAEEQDGSIYYIFSTINNYGYTVYFNVNEYTDYVKDYPLLLQKSYSFGFHKRKFNKNQKNIKDRLVFETIYKIALDFLSQQGVETVLLYHYDTSDGRQACRDRLFNNWGEIASRRQNILRHTLEVVIGTGTETQKNNYLGFLTLRENPLVNDIKNEFEEFSICLITQK